MGNEVSNNSSYNNFFKDNILWENNEIFFWVRGDIDISIFYVKTIDNTIKTIDSFQPCPALVQLDLLIRRIIYIQ